MSLEPQGPADWAGVAAFLAVIGGGLKWLWSKLARGVSIEDREERYIAKVERRIAAIEGELTKIKRDYGLVVGIAHVMVDDLLVVNPQSQALAMVAALVREAYPLVTDTPSEMMHLLHRLDAAGRKGEAE